MGKIENHRHVCKMNLMKIYKKIFVLVFLSLLFVVNISYSEVVKKIEVNGNVRISVETIAVFGDIALDKNYETDDVNNLIKKLYDTTFFSEIAINIKNETLIITVKENPIINEITFSGEKAKKFKEAMLSRLSLKEKGSYVDNLIKGDINLIKEFYRNLGYYFAKIDLDVENLQKNRVNLVYKIDKGEKAKISKIFFLGDKKIRERKLRDIITSQENKFWKFISKNVYLNKGRIDLDKRLLKTYYKNKGYYEVSIKSSNVEYADGEGFVLNFNIDAGKRYKFKKFSANVDDSLDKNAFLSLEPEFNKLVGKYYSVKDLNLVLEVIDKLSEQKELQFINHNVLETLEDDGVQVKINIFEGQKVIIERINIVGNNVTNDSVIRSELIVDEGDPFSALLVNKSINEIKARNIFGKVEHSVQPGSTDDQKVLEIVVEEKATGEIMAGAGVGTDGTSFQLAVSENNWLGRGVKLQSALNLSTERVSGNIDIINPNYNFSGNEVSTSLEVSSTDRSASSGFKSSRTGFSLGTSFEQYQDVFISPVLSSAFEDIEVLDTASDSVKKMKGNFFNTDLGYGITVDKRDQSFKPTDGYTATFRQTLPLVMDSSSISNGFNISSYHGITEDLIGSIKFQARAINGVDDDVRLTNRLYLPKTRLRGFNTARVGPKDGDDYIGGNYATSLSAEAQLPNLLPESYKTDFSVFVDTGNVWSVDYSNSIDDSNKIRSSVGFSANVYTTVGPLSFTIAESLTQADSDETETFNFRLGTSF